MDYFISLQRVSRNGNHSIEALEQAACELKEEPVLSLDGKTYYTLQQVQKIELTLNQERPSATQ